MKKALPLTLVLVGTALLITAVVFWIDSSTSAEPQSFGKTLLDWVTLIAGLGASIKGWIDLFKKEKSTPPTLALAIKDSNPQFSTGERARNIQAHIYVEKQVVQLVPESRKLDSSNRGELSKPSGEYDIELKRNNGSRARYLDALDSARFARSLNEQNEEDKENEEQIHLLTLLYAKAQFILTLAFGDTVVVTDNQLFDSEGFIDAFDEFYKAAQDMSTDIDLPIKVAKLNASDSMYEVIAAKLNNEKFTLSLWKNLDKDIPRRKLWANSFSQKQIPTENVLIEEKIYLDKLRTALEYFVPERSIVAIRTGSMLGDLIKRVINLSDEDIEDLHTGLRPGLPKYFIYPEDADAAKEIREILKSIENKVKELDRSKIMLELENYNDDREGLRDGVIALTNAVYNFTNGIGTRAALVQNSMFPKRTHKYARAGYMLATYLYDTISNSQHYTKWEIYSVDYFDKLEVRHDKRRTNEFISLIEAALRNTPWRKMIEVQNQVEWLESLQKFRETLLQLQFVHESISVGINNADEIKELELRRNQLEKNMHVDWEEHIRNTTDATANSFWKITPTKIIFSHPQIKFAIHLSYSFLKTKSYMAQDHEYERWQNKQSLRGRFDERIDRTR